MSTKLKEGEHITTIVLKESTFKKVEELARKNNRSRSGQIRQIIEEAINSRIPAHKKDKKEKMK